jgi:hypothetical protein
MEDSRDLDMLEKTLVLIHDLNDETQRGFGLSGRL